MRVKTENLSGVLLDYAVATCRHLQSAKYKHPVYSLESGRVYESMGTMSVGYAYAPSRIWGQAGVIIEREKICTEIGHNGVWISYVKQNYSDSKDCMQSGNFALVAAMRCYVAMVIGECIDIPDDLYNLQIGK